MGAPPESVAAAVADAHRREWALVLASAVRVTRDLDLGEECAQDAFAQALTAWAARGIPDRPGAWLSAVARRRAVDAVRRREALGRKLPLLVSDVVDEAEPLGPAAGGGGGDGPLPPQLADDRLRLVFTCCHPALGTDAQVALTLRLVCGLSTAEVARAFLVSEPTMAARITRAKKKIVGARIPFRVPSGDELPARVDAALATVHLVFTTGHQAPTGGTLQRRDLVERAADLARMLRSLLPRDPHVAGLLGLILLSDARSAARTGPDGRLRLLAEQDRSLWDRRAIAEGVALARESLAATPPSRYALQAAIAAVHARAPSYEATDWAAIVALYDELQTVWPSPVVALNRAVAVGLADGPAAGLVALAAVAKEPQLQGYSYLPAARADFLRRLGRLSEAKASYEEAFSLTDNAVEREFLAGRIAEVTTSQSAAPSPPEG